MSRLNLALRQRWAKLSFGQQNQVLILACALLLGLYGLWYSGIYKEITRQHNMISRLHNRMETRAADIPQPKPGAATERRIDELKARIGSDQASLARLQQRFVPDDQAELQQKLRHELSTLASGLNMRVVRLENARRRQSDKAPTLDEVNQHNNPYGRPLLLFEAWGSYFALQSLLDELGTLSYTVAPVTLQVRAEETAANAQQALSTPQNLRIELVLAI